MSRSICPIPPEVDAELRDDDLLPPLVAAQVADDKPETTQTTEAP